MRSKAVLVLWAAAVAGLAGAASAEPTSKAVEFHHAGLGVHLLTADVREIAELDAGGWRRTGGEFGVHAAAGDAGATVPVCRYRGPHGGVFLQADATGCAAADAAAGWTAEGIAFHLQAREGEACGRGATPVWRLDTSRGEDADPDFRYTVDATVAARAAESGSRRVRLAACAPLSEADREADARRLLRQATFGPTPADVARVLAIGPAAWVDEQLRLPATAYTDYPRVPAVRPPTCVNDRTPPLRPDSYCQRDNYTLFPLQAEFFRHALAQPDQLRGRVAFALSQVFVTSGLDNGRNYAMRHYQQMLRDRAFGNYLELLREVTLSPVMGDYLDMANNNKGDPVAGTSPNENYAREVLQLFSIGLWQLAPDGTRRLDGSGRPVPTYDLDEIEGFARVFTGWTYPAAPGVPARRNNPRNYLGPMIPVAGNHDFGSKPLLDGTVAPAGLSVEQDLAFALANIAGHANVGPFISRQLIQKLVTGDPTPEYVARVAATFADNGAGIRGDLRAVVRAILLDPEARGARKIDPGHGKLAEPVLWMTSVARAFGGRTDGVFFRSQSNALGQFLFYPSSVFNYYPPDHLIAGTGVTAPEFAILDTSTAFARANAATALVLAPRVPPDPSVYGATGTALDFAPWQADATDAGALADRLGRELLAGRMPSEMRAAIVAAVQALPAGATLERARTAAWLVVTSPQFQVER